MALRYYANAAPQQTLSGAITNSATSLTVAGSFSGWPTQYPFFATLDIGTASAEIVSVTNVVGTTATIVRGQGGTSAISHPAGAKFDQTTVAQDFRDANDHVNNNAGVHGVSGSVVGTSDSQTLTNKTLTNPAINAAVLSGTLSGAATLSGALTLSGAVSATGAATGLAVTNNATIGGTLGVTGAATLGSAAVTGALTVGGNPIASGAWTAFSPALTAVTTNPTLGTGGTTTGKYTQTGKKIEGWGRINFGTAGTNAGSGFYAVSFPVAGATSPGAGMQLEKSQVLLTCAGVTTTAWLEWLTSTTARLIYNSTALNGSRVSVANTLPGAWTANDIIQYNFTYEAA